MHTFNKVATSLIVVCSLLLLVIVSGAAYYLGTQRQEQQVDSLQAEQITRERDYANTIEALRLERNRALNNYDTACLEYQELRAAYETLYESTGEASGLPKYSSPDDARGNEESCYR